MKKIVITVMCIMIILFASGCGSPQLDEAFDEELVKEQAESIISLINKKNYDSVVELERDDLKEALSKEILEEVMTPIIDECGTFQEYSKITVLGQTDKSSNEAIAVAVCQCKYENASKIYTI